MNKPNEKGGLMNTKRQNLKNIYDVINKIARQHKEKGEDITNWFYTKKQVEELKKDPKNKFI